MKVYAFQPTELQEFVVPAPSAAVALDGVSGIRQGSGWQPAPVELVTAEDGRALEPVDAPFLSFGLLVVKTAMLPRVAALVAQDAELLPLDCQEAELTGVNVTRVIDALDESASDLVRFRSGRIMLVDRYAFHAMLLPPNGLFKIPQDLNGATFCTESAAADLTAELSGINLQLAWEG